MPTLIHRRTQDFTMEGVTLVDARGFCLGVTWRARSASSDGENTLDNVFKILFKILP